VKFAAGLLLGIALVTTAAVSPRVSRSNLVSLEKMTDGKIIILEPSNPARLLGATRGVYLDGYGAVFTTEVDLIAHAALNPFRPEYADADVTRLRAQKKARILMLKQRMQESLVIMAQQLEGVPKNEQIALAVTIPYWPWEKSAGMPSQILMQASKSALLDAASLNTTLRVQEF
jgi:hypothetical protein